MANMTCEACRTAFKTYTRKQRFCSKKCASAAKRVRIDAAFVARRFWAYVKKGDNVDDCWIWQGPKLVSGGYGVLQLGRTYKQRAHRVSYEIHHGHLPSSAFVCHRCDNPPCVNPSHLFLGDAAVNNADKMSKGRWVDVYALRDHCSKGHAYTPENTIMRGGHKICRQCKREHKLASHHRMQSLRNPEKVRGARRKFTDEELAAIRSMQGSLAEISKIYRVSGATIHAIRTRTKAYSKR